MLLAGYYAYVVGAFVLALFCVWVLRRRRTVYSLSKLQGKVVLVTGASSGLGEACARAFYCAGCRLILCARRSDQLNRVADDLKRLIIADRITHEPQILILDISQFSRIHDSIQTAINLYGHIDIVVNNAGVSYRGSILGTTLDVHHSVMNVNYFGQVAVTRELLPSMVARKSGHVVVITSVQGKIALPFRSAYGASKHACQSFFECLRSEVAQHNIDVTIVCPGYIQTNLSVNAVTGDGGQYGLVDETHQTGMDANDVAQEILKVIAKRKKTVIIAPLIHRLTIYLQELFPDTLSFVMSWRAAKLHHKQM